MIDKKEDDRSKKKKNMAFRKLLLDTVDFYTHIRNPYWEKKNGLMILLKIEDDLFDREIEKGK